jgi:hypothetical protein
VAAFPVTSDEILNAVWAWQTAGWVNPLTCETDHCHGPLEPVDEGDRVVLRCRDCEYQQEQIPEIVLVAKVRPLGS